MVYVSMIQLREWQKEETSVKKKENVGGIREESN